MFTKAEVKGSFHSLTEEYMITKEKSKNDEHVRLRSSLWLCTRTLFVRVCVCVQEVEYVCCSKDVC